MSFNKIDYEQCEDVWIIFTKTENRFFANILKPWFGHVYAITRDKYNWIAFNPKHSRLLYKILPFSVNQFAPLLVADRYDRIVHLSLFKREVRRRFGIFGLRSCVTIVQYLFDLKCVGGLTPYGFYTRLLRLSERKRTLNGIIAIEEVKK